MKSRLREISLQRNRVRKNPHSLESPAWRLSSECGLGGQLSNEALEGFDHTRCEQTNLHSEHAHKNQILRWIFRRDEVAVYLMRALMDAHFCQKRRFSLCWIFQTVCITRALSFFPFLHMGLPLTHPFRALHIWDHCSIYDIQAIRHERLPSVLPSA